jgi:UPF0755 protein
MAPSKRTLLRAAAAFLLLLAGVIGYAFYGSNSFPTGGQRPFFVSKGEKFPAIVDSLENAGIIRSRSLFLFVARVLGGTERVQVGKYLFQSGVSNEEIFTTLRSGKGNTLIQVTVPEGLRSRQQARLFARTIGTDSAKFAVLVHEASFAHSLGVTDSTLEGYLLPDSYGFYWQQGEEDVLRAMVAQFWLFYGDSLARLQEALGWTTGQVLTLASIVEGEAVHDNERPIIAGVYLNRLRKGMKLEADPTVQFVVNERPRRLLYSDLKVDNPYNTYLYPGLPPGPVNNPGRASILAALSPAKHNYIFFVADGRGGHWFARSYGEHMKNVRLYRRYRAQQQG